MPTDQPLHAVPRQRPVSCRLCRSRKLRCNREAPCSNCVSRGIRCEREHPTASSPETGRASESELLDRIRRLEALVDNQHTQKNQSQELHSERSVNNIQQASMPTRSPQIEHLDSDVAFLENIYSRQDTAQEKMPSNKIVFKICSIQHAMEAQPYINQHAFSSSINFEPLRCVWMPQYPEAKILLEKFIQDIDHIHHVVHTPSLPSMLDEIYACLDQQGQVKPGIMILLLGIFASCTQSWVRRDCGRGLFSTPAEANSQARLWIRAVEDVLQIAHRTTPVSIEGIQGIIITSFVLANFEGFSRTLIIFYNVALLLARELGLHCLDHPNNADFANSARAEMGRRVWWYLVASDWQLAARLNGFVQGVYQCNPRHMITKKPLDVNDEDLIDGMSRIEQPFSRPTSMSYMLLRIRLAEISRSIVDRTPLFTAQTGGPSYDAIMDIDTELQLLINDIPLFFSMSVATLSSTYHLDALRAASIAHQGYMFRSNIYSLRCKLHFPYFSRGFMDSTYASSREICLQTARLIIQNETQLDHLELCKTLRCKFLGLVMSVFMSSIVLLMDICYNKSPSQQDKRRGEIADAMRILEDARHESETAAKFMESVMQVLRKHKVSPLKRGGQQLLSPRVGTDQLLTVQNAAIRGGTLDFNATITPPYSETAEMSLPMASPVVLRSNEGNNITMADDGFTNGDDLSSYFNEVAQSFEQGIEDSGFDWNNIFDGLERSFI